MTDLVFFLWREFRHVPTALRQQEDRIVAESMLPTHLVTDSAFTDSHTVELSAIRCRYDDRTLETTGPEFLRHILHHLQDLRHFVRKRGIYA